MCISPAQSGNLSGYELSKQMFESTKQINTLRYRMNKKERINGKMIEQQSSVKLSRHPYKVYTRQSAPNDGVEALYISGDHKALINPNGFPWVNLKLDPYGSIMRQGQHHTILDAGYDHFISILEFLFNKYGPEKTKEMVKLNGEDNIDGHSCWVIAIHNPHFKYYDYTVKPGESILTIADKYKLSEHMILEKNKDLDDYYDVATGQIIQIPNDYSPKIFLYIDKKRNIPLLIKIYDDQGLYELYEYLDVVVNPVLKPEEFTKEYEQYGF